MAEYAPAELNGGETLIHVTLNGFAHGLWVGRKSVLA